MSMGVFNIKVLENLEVELKYPLLGIINNQFKGGRSNLNPPQR